MLGKVILYRTAIAKKFIGLILLWWRTQQKVIRDETGINMSHLVPFEEHQTISGVK